MKFPAAYYLMLIYLSVMFRPLIPFIRDAYSHTFNESIHLATVHAKYGSDHLGDALAKSGEESNSKNGKNINSGENFSIHIRTLEYMYDFSLIKMNDSYRLTPFLKLSAIFLPKTIPPPKYVA